MVSAIIVYQIRILSITVQLNSLQSIYLNHIGTLRQHWPILQPIFYRVQFLQPMVMVHIQSVYMTVMQSPCLQVVHIRGHLMPMEVFSNSIQI